jgi:hypothetical protein
MYILRALVFLFLTQAVLAEQPTPILPDAKLTPGHRWEDLIPFVTFGPNQPKLRPGTAM